MKITSLLLLILSAIYLTSCRNDEPKPNPEPGQQNATRTVLVYMVASNSLNSAAADDIESMRTAISHGALQNGRLLIYKVGYLTSPELIELTPDGTSTLKSYPGVTSSVTAEAMKQVVSDMKSLAPADDYGAILWSHSTGWLSPFKMPSQASRSWGDDQGAKMSIPDLASALQSAGFSFVYFDCCFMGNIETLYELKGTTPLIVASPVEVPADGMPYETNLQYFFSDKPDLTRIARNTYEHYNALTGSARSCAMSVYDMNAIDKVAQAAADILATNTVTPEGMEYQQYGFHTSWNNFENLYYDMGQYYESLTDDQTLLTAYRTAMKKFITYTAATPQMWGQWNLSHTSGVSTYIFSENPDIGIVNGYDQLAWWRDVVGANQ
ncbi:MAG: clostripain-related cysteine peptidase [Muribaculum sp.]|nr:clostripain-related cysteine peptidase [Muribaculum sp.]